MKRLGAFLIALFVCFCSLSAFAANPQIIYSGDSGNASDLIVVRRPESKNSATIKTTYGITGTGRYGINVSYYQYNGSYYTSIAQTTIGSAGVFYKQVSLSEGHNKFAVRAESASGTYQVVYFDINLLNQEIMNNVTTFAGGIQSLYNGWMN